MLIRDTPQAFAKAIVDILDHPALGAEIGARGRQWVVEKHAWTHSAALLHDTYAKLIGHEDPTLHMDKRETAVFVARLHEALEDTDQEGEEND
jgi:hypothetical protein